MVGVVVDCENCSCNLIKALSELAGIDLVLVYGSKQMVDHIKVPRRVRCGKCTVARKDSADIAVLYEINNLVLSKRYDTCIIVSGDKGFDSMLDELTTDRTVVYRADFRRNSKGIGAIYLVLKGLSNIKSGQGILGLHSKLVRESGLSVAEVVIKLSIIMSLGIIHIGKDNRVYWSNSMVSRLCNIG